MFSGCFLVFGTSGNVLSRAFLGPFWRSFFLDGVVGIPGSLLAFFDLGSFCIAWFLRQFFRCV